MEICIICPEIGNSGGNAFIGGHVNNVVRTSEVLYDRGHEIHFITTSHRYPNKKGQNGIEWAKVHCISTSGSYLSLRYGMEFFTKSLFKIKKLHKEEKFDIIHGHSGYSMPAMITGISSKLTGVPAVQTVYCPILPNRENVVRSFSNELFSKYYFFGINRIFSVTGNVRNSLILAGIPENKIEYVPIGIDLNVYDTTLGFGIRERYELDSHIPVLVYIGNLAKNKGVHILLDALGKVIKEHCNLKLFIVLNLPIEEYYNPTRIRVDMQLIDIVKDKIKTLNLEKNVIFVGLTNNLAEIIAASDIFVMPFLNTRGIADYPTSLLEAMACGKPIIATKIGGIPEIIKDDENGLLVESEDPDGLSEAIIQLLGDKKKRLKMAKNNSEYIKENFNVVDVAHKMERIYGDILQENSI